MNPVLSEKILIAYKFPAKLSRLHVFPPSSVLYSDPDPPHAYPISPERKPTSRIPKPLDCNLVGTKSSVTPCVFPKNTSPPRLVNHNLFPGIQPMFCILLPDGRLCGVQFLSPGAHVIKKFPREETATYFPSTARFTDEKYPSKYDAPLIPDETVRFRVASTVSFTSACHDFASF